MTWTYRVVDDTASGTYVKTRSILGEAILLAVKSGGNYSNEYSYGDLAKVTDFTSLNLEQQARFVQNYWAIKRFSADDKKTVAQYEKALKEGGLPVSSSDRPESTDANAVEGTSPERVLARLPEFEAAHHLYVLLRDVYIG